MKTALILLLACATNALSKEVTYTHNNPLPAELKSDSQSNQQNQATTYELNDQNLISNLHYPDGKSVAFSYDLNGNRTSMTDWQGETAYTYDALNRLTKIQYPTGDSLSYHYDTCHRLDSMTYPDGSMVQYHYDHSSGKLEYILGPGGMTKFVYDSATHLLKKRSSDDGIETLYEYDDDHRVTNVAHYQYGTPLISFTYAYDANGNRTKITREEPSSSLSAEIEYDPLNRVTRITYSTGDFEAYTYDAVGNRLSKTTQKETVRYTYDVANRLTSANDTTYTYDESGNLIKKKSSKKLTRYSYNSQNKLAKVEDGLTTVEFEYDGLGNRISKTINGQKILYINDLHAPISRVCLKKDPSSTTLYTYGNSLLSETHGRSTDFFLEDSPHRNIIGTAGDTNTALFPQTDAFGACASGSIPSFGYASEIRDEETGLIYLRNRYYDPEIGRFISQDSDFGDIYNPQTLNQYAYVNNNPVNFIDPTGRSATDPEEMETVYLGAHMNGPNGGNGAAGHALVHMPERGETYGYYPQGLIGKGDLRRNDILYPGRTVLSPVQLPKAGIDSVIQEYRNNPSLWWTPLKWDLDFTIPFLVGPTGNCCHFVNELLIQGGHEPLKTKGLVENALHPHPMVRQIQEMPGAFVYQGSIPESNTSPAQDTPGKPEIRPIFRLQEEPNAPSIPTNRISLNYLNENPDAFFWIDWGGINLNKRAELALTISDIKGAYYDPATGRLIVCGKKKVELPKMDADDLAVAVKSFYGLGGKTPQAPGISIESRSDGNFDVIFFGQTANTKFGKILLDGDLLLKSLTNGLDCRKDQDNTTPLNVALNNYRSFNQMCLEHFEKTGKTLLSRDKFEAYRRAQKSPHPYAIRLAIEPDEISLVQSSDTTSMQFDKTTMKVVQSAWVYGEEVEDPLVKQFADYLTSNYDTLAEQFKELREVKRLGQISGVVKWFFDNKAPLDLQYFESYQPQHVEMPKILPGYTCRWGHGCRILYYDHLGQPLGPSERSLPVGGICLFMDNLSIRAEESTPLLEYAKQAEPSPDALRWEFKAPGLSDEQTYQAEVIHIGKTPKEGNLKYRSTDLEYTVPGSLSLEFTRVYNSFACEEETPLGLGWSFLPYKVCTSPSFTQITLEGEDIPRMTGPQHLILEHRSGKEVFYPCEMAKDTEHQNILVYKSAMTGNRMYYYENLKFMLVDNSNQYTFSPEGHLLKGADPFGHMLSFEYSGDLLSEIKHSCGRSITLTYTPEKKLKEVKGPGDKAVEFTVKNGRLISVEGSCSPREYLYDSNNRLISMKSPEGAILTEVAYDDYNRVIPLNREKEETLAGIQTPTSEQKIPALSQDNAPETDARGYRHRYIYHENGTVKAHYITDLRGNTSEQTYNSIGQPQSVTEAGSLSEDGKYIPAAESPMTVYFYKFTTGALGAIHRKGGVCKNIYFNSQGEITTERIGTLKMLQEWDERSRLTKRTVGTRSVEYQYDDQDRVTRVTTPSGKRQLQYDSLGRLVSTTDFSGSEKRFTYDVTGQLSEVVDEMGYKTTYSYNSLGYLQSITLPNGHRRVFVFGPVDNLDRYFIHEVNLTNCTLAHLVRE